ncbi:PDZ domain-containing protein [Sphingobacterium sp. lm-10]|uniref:M61 family metallopeptidase n=1 Tax=Sphingobacterium sp. lm-10 TaxID=2944904 RepID=UPI0020205E37|nr:PDZ domain-containing protein [Sphingobacterium sp. lm-10]MCL7986341.1 PDZ domain-containing protein [Sphingobacterium sp. lm-10]
MSEQTKQAISYTLSFTEAQAHYVEVTLLLHGFSAEFIDLKMPVWTPGSYLIREFARHVESFTAQQNNGELVKQEKISKNTWRVYNKSKDAVVRYRVYGFETSVRTNFIDDTHAFISPAGTFMYVDGHLALPCTVHVDLPPDWSTITTGLPEIAHHTYEAENFDILFDSPIEIGNQDVWSFEAAGIPHEFAMVGGGNYNKDQLSEDIQKIVAEETRIWGSNPNDRYVFITHNYQQGGGGLEHLNSTVLGASRNAYTQATSYNNFLSLVAHEYFHLWHVKRLRPAPLGPFDYEQESYTALLWIMEGFTSYYDNLITYRCQFRDETDYLQMLAQEFNLVYNRPGYELQSVGQSSFDTWIKQYRPDENSANTSISYYNKGAMLAVAMDFKIIAETNGKRRLDDVLKAAYNQFYLKEQRGFEELEFQKLAEDVSGVDLSEIFAAVYTTEELDYNSYFNRVGYELIDQLAESKTLSLGIRTVNNDTRIYIKGVDRNSTAWKAGLNVNDEILGINGVRMDPAGKELEMVIQQCTFGQTVDILIARDGIIRTISTPLGYSDKKSLVVQRREDATTEEKALGEIWLKRN